MVQTLVLLKLPFYKSLDLLEYVFALYCKFLTILQFIHQTGVKELSIAPSQSLQIKAPIPGYSTPAFYQCTVDVHSHSVQTF